MRKICALALLMIPLLACGPTTETESTMIAWATALNGHLATGGRDGDYSYPGKLSDLDASLTIGLAKEDGWGQRFIYRRIRDDKYQMISAAPTASLATTTISWWRTASPSIR